MYFCYFMCWRKILFYMREYSDAIKLPKSLVDNRKDYTWQHGVNSSFPLLIFFLITRIRDFLLDIDSAYKSFVWAATIWLEISGCNNIVSILLLYFYYNLLIFGNFDNHRTLVRHVYIILIYNRDMYSSSWLIDAKHIIILIWAISEKSENFHQ